MLEAFHTTPPRKWRQYLRIVCTDRKQTAINHFNQALSMDPLLWVAYEELCILGAAEEATFVFDDGASIFIQKQYLQRGLASRSLQVTNEDHEITSNRIFGSEDVSPRKLKHSHGNNLLEISGNSYGTTSNQPTYGGSTSLPFYNTPSPMATQSQLSGIAPPPVCRNALPNGPSMRTYGADNSQRVNINSAVAGPRRKFVNEGKLRKVSERLFSDSGQRRSMRLAGESINANSSSSIVSGNGTSHSAKYLGVGGLNSQVKLSGFTFPHFEKVTLVQAIMLMKVS